MKNEILISTFGIRDELGPMSLSYRLPSGQLTSQQVVHSPKVLSLAELPSRVKNGFCVNGVELMDGHITAATAEERAQLRAAAEIEGVRIGTVGISRATADANDSHRAEDLAAVEQLIELAAETGSDSVRVILLPPPIVPGPKPAQFTAIIESLVRLADFAEARGLRLFIENDDELTSNPAKITEILDAVGPRLGLILDTGNWTPVMEEISNSFMAGHAPADVTDAESLYQTISDLLPRADVLHLKTYGFHPDGQSRVYDLDRVLDIVTSAGYQGPITIECMLFENSETDAVIRATIERIHAAADALQ